MSDLLLPKRLNSDNVKKWIGYYRTTIATSIYSNSYAWMVEELEDIGNDKAELVFSIVSTTSILLYQILQIFKDIQKLEDIGTDFSDKKYNIYVKQFNATKSKLSKLAGYDIDDTATKVAGDTLTIEPIVKPIHSMFLLKRKNNLTKYNILLLNEIFNKIKIKANETVITDDKKKEDEAWKEILKIYPHLKNLPSQ